jgi:hypothetical protein
MKKKILFFLVIVFVLALGNVSKIAAFYTEIPKDNIRDMASCGPNCRCCLNNTYTYCGAASCSE